jgi:hypothetical protein
MASTAAQSITIQEAREARIGFYVVAREGWSTHVLLGPYLTEAEARGHIDQVRTWVVRQRSDAFAWAFDVDKMRRPADGRLLRLGQFNLVFRYAPNAAPTAT